MVRPPVEINKGPIVPSRLTSNRPANISTENESQTPTSPKTSTGLCPHPTKEEVPKVKKELASSFPIKTSNREKCPTTGRYPLLTQKAQVDQHSVSVLTLLSMIPMCWYGEGTIGYQTYRSSPTRQTTSELHHAQFRYYQIEPVNKRS